MRIVLLVLIIMVVFLTSCTGHTVGGANIKEGPTYEITDRWTGVTYQVVSFYYLSDTSIRFKTTDGVEITLSGNWAVTNK